MRVTIGSKKDKIILGSKYIFRYGFMKKKTDCKLNSIIFWH